MRFLLLLIVIIGGALGIFFAYGFIIKLLIERQGLSVTSWWRTVEHNAEVGGVPNSMHLLGLAWDVLPVTNNNAEYLRSLGLTVIDEGDHLHAMVKV